MLNPTRVVTDRFLRERQTNIVVPLPILPLSENFVVNYHEIRLNPEQIDNCLVGSTNSFWPAVDRLAPLMLLIVLIRFIDRLNDSTQPAYQIPSIQSFI